MVYLVRSVPIFMFMFSHSVRQLTEKQRSCNLQGFKLNSAPRLEQAREAWVANDDTCLLYFYCKKRYDLALYLIFLYVPPLARDIVCNRTTVSCERRLTNWILLLYQSFIKIIICIFLFLGLSYFLQRFHKQLQILLKTVRL